MTLRPALSLLSCLLFLPALGCGGGGPSSAASQPGCNQQGAGEALCLVSCNLGCSRNGCAITNIAQNQTIILTFNQPIDPTSVSTSSVSLRTSSGAQPVGQLLTQDNVVTFVPGIRVVGASSFLGFAPQETYELRLPGGPNELNALRSVSGDAFAKTVVCNLRVTLGVIDQNGKPPSSTLISPSSPTNVSPSTSIVLEFDELIDNTPFLAAPPGGEPIRVLVAKTVPVSGGGLGCDTTETPQLRGAWRINNDIVRQISTCTFTPSQVIPNAVCVTVQVTNGVTDLAGVRSPGETHTYITRVGNQPPIRMTENFSDDLQFDTSTSSGSWLGGAAPGTLGRDGLHGEFDPANGVNKGSGVFEWQTVGQTIPQTNFTLSGVTETVNDGVFRFSKFVLPAGTTVRFVGPVPARIHVRGEMQIDGKIDLAGQSLSEPNGGNATGQAGGLGGANGGAGGKGGDRGNGTSSVLFDGANGANVRPIPGHAYANLVTGTGGKGSLHFPDTNAGLTSNFLSIVTIQVAAGGGGGGFMTPGLQGVAVETRNQVGQNFPGDLGPPAPGGIAFNVLPLPAGASVLDHFLVGGSGGGGAGSHPYNTQVFSPGYRSGGGGGGGGGAVGLRIGRSLAMSSTGVVSSAGGNTSASNANSFGVPGGGGSGGSIVVQVARPPQMSGVLDVSGGTGGTVFNVNPVMSSRGGNGGAGYLRVEAPGPLPPTAQAWTGVTLPPSTMQNVAALQEEDLVTGVQSLFYPTNQLFQPTYVRYEVAATVGGNPVTYSDDPRVGPLAAGSSPVRFYAQAASNDPNGLIIPSTIGLWRQHVGAGLGGGQTTLNDENERRAFRFLLLFDRSVLGPAVPISVQRVTIVLTP